MGNIFFNEDETLILLDGLLAVYDGRMTRSQAIESVSNELRLYLKDKGKILDTSDRSVKGIRSQMYLMEYQFTNGKKGFCKTAVPQLFVYAVDFYKNNPSEFKNKLNAIRNGKQMPNMALHNWLNSYLTERQLSSIYNAFNDIERYAQDNKFIKNHLFDNSTEEIYILVQKILSIKNLPKILRRAIGNNHVQIRLARFLTRTQNYKNLKLQLNKFNKKPTYFPTPMLTVAQSKIRPDNKQIRLATSSTQQKVVQINKTDIETIKLNTLIDELLQKGRREGELNIAIKMINAGRITLGEVPKFFKSFTESDIERLKKEVDL